MTVSQITVDFGNTHLMSFDGVGLDITKLGKFFPLSSPATCTCGWKSDNESAVLEHMKVASK